MTCMPETRRCHRRKESSSSWRASRRRPAAATSCSKRAPPLTFLSRKAFALHASEQKERRAAGSRKSSPHDKQWPVKRESASATR